MSSIRNTRNVTNAYSGRYSRMTESNFQAQESEGKSGPAVAIEERAMDELKGTWGEYVIYTDPTLGPHDPVEALQSAGHVLRAVKVLMETCKPGNDPR